MRLSEVVTTQLLLLGVVLSLRGVDCQPRVPCFFIFGDSLSDGGNNNDLATMARADFPPYGLDYPPSHKPTGRFGNGRVPVDLIAEKLELPGHIPPFRLASDPQVADKGVNYASGSSGIMPETGQVVGGRIPLDEQLKRHKEIIGKIQTIHGPDTNGYLQQCLYSVWVGSNDWMLNYFLNPFAKNPTKSLPNQFADQLIQRFTGQFDQLYQMGARKVILFGLSPLGCLPPLNLYGVCTDFTNGVLKDYNERLKKFADGFRAKYPDLKISYIDVYGIYGEGCENLKKNGFQTTDTPCCGAADPTCLPTSIVCPDRSKFVHWDNAHPTEAVNQIIAARAFIAQEPTDAIPEDINHLVM